MESGAKDGRAPAGFSRFYKARRRIYGLLLLFVVAVGVSTASVPKLRNRLVTRALAIWDAATGEHEPMMVQVGQNQERLPQEFERPAPHAMQIPRMPIPKKALTTPEGGYRPGSDGARASSEGATASESEPEESDGGPKYQQGTMEQEAYDLLLSSTPGIAEIVKGNNPSYIFKSWDAAGRGDDIYWVRLKLEAEGKPAADYIWQVRLGSKQVSPLNFNARRISATNFAN
ncbi:MAG: hypothetical protein JXA73_17370 [Acidobacteria bacterium]|nr:hypothetical protein [Acidobacteriota bacterium]